MTTNTKKQKTPKDRYARRRRLASILALVLVASLVLGSLVYVISLLGMGGL